MEEVFPVVSGVVLGLATFYLARGRSGIWILGAFGVLLGMMASWVSGELAISWIYPVIDTAQVLAAGVMTRVLAARGRRWARAALRRSA